MVVDAAGSVTTDNPDGQPDPTNRMERRRVKTRHALLAAGVRVIADRGIDRLTIASITEGADVALGSFYNHFENSDDFLRQLSDEAIAGWFDDARRLRHRVPVDQAERIAGSCVVLARRGAADITWARFVTETLARREIPATTELRNLIAFGVQAGVDDGSFECEHAELTAAIILGAMRQVLVHIGDGHPAGEAPAALATAVLLVCGMDRERAAEVAAYAVANTDRP